ncbi:hypothetical protein EV188_109154 [Actinomycetospora succinea]|uniref:DUF4345 domain-containing protein n=1 Tax=Actinomycetospora succinea TaxID=663603 RepID=A0A4R6UZ93_9PSEU|nr:hypothetical protein [Actinomycetospora succinea]TDQ50945.1 hypothetical protein EV188_109154 [Actinomycetospora succinea]
MIARVLLAVLAAMQFVIGLWALFLPLAFYEVFPYGGTPWVALLPPYNEHLVRDHGAGTLALGVALAFAVWWPERRLVIAVIVSFLVFAVPHAVFHTFHLEHFPLVDAIGQQAAFALEIVLAIAVLVALPRERVRR